MGSGVDMSEILESIKCNVCGSEKTELFLQLDGFGYQRCTNCGLVYQNPRPVFNDLKKRYRENYFDYEVTNQVNFFNLMKLGLKDCYDIYQYGVNVELGYECAMTGTNSYNVHFCYLCLWQVADLLYCIETYSSKDCFGCVGLKKNQYCILNKQYSKDEYFDLKNM